MFSKEYLTFIENSKKQSLDIVGASVVETFGSTYAKVGNMILVNSDYDYVGVLGSPLLHNKIIDLAKEVFESCETIYYENKAKDKSSGHGLSRYLIQPFYYKNNYESLGLALENYGKTLVRSIKDGSFEIIDDNCEDKLENGKFYQKIKAPYSLLVFGSGAHVSSLISMANLMGWKTSVIDLKIRENYVKEADELIKLDHLQDIIDMDLNSYNASVILSHSPKTDDVYLKALLNSNVEYIGILGNKKNMKKKTKEFDLYNEKRFFAPVGIDIGGTSHQSIALSICAQIEARKNGKI
ncbi:MAG: XdhC family protein [Campylobacteraceae bacterium]|nr:XdhC family protein [Campylobacteraceae bacterium]